jgi:hypothetical protein
MRKFAALVLCFCLLAGCTGREEALELKTGSYFLETAREMIMVPYLYLDMENHTAHVSGGMVISYAETGTVTIKGSQILVETAKTTYVLRMQDGKTLILTDCAGENPFDLPLDGKLVYNEEWS